MSKELRQDGETRMTRGDERDVRGGNNSRPLTSGLRNILGRLSISKGAPPPVSNEMQVSGAMPRRSAKATGGIK